MKRDRKERKKEGKSERRKNDRKDESWMTVQTTQTKNKGGKIDPKGLCYNDCQR